MPKTSSDIFKKIRKIQMHATKLANEILAGPWHSAFKGQGMEFEEVREYQPGDDIRNIDWNVTARMNKPFIKIFKEERELTVFIVVDISASSFFGSLTETKREIIASLGASLAFSAIKNSDKVGLILFSEEVEKYLTPKKGTRHVLRVIRELLAEKPKKEKTNINNALSFLGKVQSRRAICFFISDFLADFDPHLMSIIAKHHDLISICISDPYEMDFPKMDLVNLCDLESGETFLIDSQDENAKNKFKQAAQKRIENLEKQFKKIGASFIHIKTDEPYITPIQKFFNLRKIKH